ncbi:sugar transferase [Acetohalobium arabaticum]|uniref:Undecaprenyl-phosphate galactose phosphotransferase n=1 Tax=Acetohalobium arabaticum (strain ATCC 49924 / DSM 5501 / Z-7288) TaxID=574087 RepID=D9QTS2_ACEAZ|nr:sugar transferase [Acetohalobium arabaticum]ADL13643.1 Undecaprenyl-phosphate galactose phosphotransferase [Acetohalobium arabaticum DSM 5501]
METSATKNDDIESIQGDANELHKVESNYIYNAVSRGLDIVLASVGMILLAPVFIIVAYKIKKNDGGNIFFKHTRIGKDTEEFKMYKFRTMVPNAEEKLQEVLENDEELRKEFYENFKLKDDPRITEIGDFLRKTSLDELPQLINIIKGDMSLVGPRPVVDDELEMHYKGTGDIVFSVKPGLTGMWQVNGRSDVEDYEERIALDLKYVKERSLLLDMKIILKTIKSVIKREGAY